MDRATEERWRAALKLKGKEIVQAELDLRPGRATDVCYDVGDQPPYPPREFLEAWCRGKPPRSVGLSGPTSMVIAMSLLVVVCIIRAIGSFSPSEKNWLSDGLVPYSRESVPTMRGNGQQTDDAVQNSQIITTIEQRTERAACSAVSSSGNLRTVQTLSACSKLGSASAQQKAK